MSQSNRYEQEFLTKLKAVFIGAQVEGDSGYINLTRIKARYFAEGVFPRLRRDVGSQFARAGVGDGQAVDLVVGSAT